MDTCAENQWSADRFHITLDRMVEDVAAVADDPNPEAIRANILMQWVGAAIPAGNA